MKPKSLFDRIYLGDRYCKSFIREDDKKQLEIQVNCISLMRPGTSKWDFYTGGDIHDGWIVFSDVEEVALEPPDILPNDSINEINAEADPDSAGRYRIEISMGAVDHLGNYREVTLRAKSATAHIEDSARTIVQVS